MSDPVYNTQEDLDEALEYFTRHFDMARVVNPIENEVSCCVVASEKDCFDVWNKTARCRNCVSSRVLLTGETAHKLERINGADTYLITSERIKTPDGPQVLELVSRMERSFDQHYGSSAEEHIRIAELEIMAYQDSLTGVFSRRYAEERVEEELANRTEEGTVAFALIDIDDLKVVNDQYGHIAGDSVIRSAASRIAKTLYLDGEQNGFLARVGGDEFCALLRCPSQSVAVSMFNHVITAVHAAGVTDFPQLTPSTSIGLMFLEEGEFETFTDVLRVADARMYIAKKLMKNCVVTYDEPHFDPPPAVEGEKRLYRRDEPFIREDITEY